MPAFYLTFIAAMLAGIGARDQITIAGLALAQGRRPAVLIVAIVTGVLSAAFAGWAAHWMLGQLPPPARSIFAGLALALAGIESMVLAPRRGLREPTNSLGALALVLLAHQATDAVRFVVFGLGVGLAGPWPAGVGGALGSAVLVTFAWGQPGFFEKPALRLIRRVTGAALLLAAAVIVFRQFGIL
ncbi:hypothetical protein [Novosphingobium guangzhouense]|uniref:GDT1 family protein n=1 Tax=Novosphingobium guangzhouense TaxID=1850347 RepID=A0A2K2FZ36_9SPHN|nr:hypothetical protein [Novosphingobium guangzhouense]PNU04057.1 hypothetical protein A8V01_05480 [Novosphingobium guangzhouense]